RTVLLHRGPICFPGVPARLGTARGEPGSAPRNRRTGASDRLRRRCVAPPVAPALSRKVTSGGPGSDLRILSRRTADKNREPPTTGCPPGTHHERIEHSRLPDPAPDRKLCTKPRTERQRAPRLKEMSDVFGKPKSH